MTPAEWKDVGKVLSFTKLRTALDGTEKRYNLAVVAVEDGPKVPCWTTEMLKPGAEVDLSMTGNRCDCRERTG